MHGHRNIKEDMMGEECGTDGRKKECIAGFGGETCR